MTSRIFFLLLFICCFFVSIYPQKENPINDYNLDFERIDGNKNFPKGWFPWGPNHQVYEIKLDSAEKQSGNHSVVIESKGNLEKEYYECVSTKIPSVFEGKEIELIGFVKLENVTEKAGFVIRIDDDNRVSSGVQNNSISGTHNWKPNSLKIPLPQNSKVINIAACLYGSGKIWVDNFQVLIDGKDISQAKFKEPQKEPLSDKILAGILLLGSFQGLIISLFLFFQKDFPKIKNISLGILLIILGYDFLQAFFYATEFFTFPKNIITIILFFLSSEIFLSVIGPGIYLHTKYSLTDSTPPKRIYLVYLPLIIQLVFRIAIFYIWFSDRVYSLWLLQIHFYFSLIFNALYNGIFLFLAWRELKTVSKNSDFSKEQRPILRYLSIVLILSGLIIVLRYVHQYPYWGVLMIFIYFVAFRALQKIKIISQFSEKRTNQLAETISEEDVNICLGKLKNAMEVDKIYLDPELNLNSLASHIQRPPREVSFVINQHLKTGFVEYVNSFRVEEVKVQLLKPEAKIKKIIAIAFDAGFNSSSTFQRVFKNITGMTPKQFQEKHNQK